ncbi:MAG: TetR/AcrR family transcriptional regulator [Gammaproteobacteria bacterium]
MQKRRGRLLAEARRLLARGGYEALNLRDLAQAAGVTVPTIYNLIGRKEDVLLAVAAGVLSEVEARTAPARAADPLDQAAAVVETSTRLFAEEPEFYRAAFLAVEWLDQGGQHHAEVARIYAWVGDLMESGLAACRDAGLIVGDIPPAQMAALITRSFRMSCRGWAFGHYDVDEFRRLALGDFYITLCADAVETFRRRLTRRIATLAAPAAQASTSTGLRAQVHRGESQ